MTTVGGKEVEVKFQVHDAASLAKQLRELGFQQTTPPTHEVNDIFDRGDHELRGKRELLRLREFGGQWKLTFKGKATDGRHKTRQEVETKVGDGRAAAEILVALGFFPMFRYEKYRSEWTDGVGEVVIDVTPIGVYGEIEGSPEWIDSTAAKLGVAHHEFITKSYATLFLEWKSREGSSAENMTFMECGTEPPGSA